MGSINIIGPILKSIISSTISCIVWSIPIIFSSATSFIKVIARSFLKILWFAIVIIEYIFSSFACTIGSWTTRNRNQKEAKSPESKPQQGHRPQRKPKQIHRSYGKLKPRKWFYGKLKPKKMVIWKGGRVCDSFQVSGNRQHGTER